jgi:hypothetical protein
MTHLTCDVSYEIPTPVIGKIAEAVLHGSNEHELDMVLAGIKSIAEERLAERARPQPAPPPQGL